MPAPLLLLLLTESVSNHPIYESAKKKKSFGFTARRRASLLLQFHRLPEKSKSIGSSNITNHSATTTSQFDKATMLLIYMHVAQTTYIWSTFLSPGRQD